MTQPKGKIRRRRQRGANLAILCGVAVMLLGFLGISIYTGLQAFIENDLQRVTTSAAMAGAAHLYGDTHAVGKPKLNSDQAITIATNAFNTAVQNSTLNGFNAAITGTPTFNDENDSLTLTSTAQIPTPFLGIVGINTIQVNASATAMALRYEPTLYTGPIRITPSSSGGIASYSSGIELTFPLVDTLGNDIYIEQDINNRQGYIVEACNDLECYDLTAGAQPVGSSQIITLADGSRAIYGSSVINLANAQVRKANKLRFTHNNQFDILAPGATAPEPMTAEQPLEISQVILFGYAGACVNQDKCSVPAGLVPVE